MMGATMVMASVMVLASASPLTSVITSNNPHLAHPHAHHEPDPSNLPPVIQWSDLYEKEVGTWCAPETSSETPPSAQAEDIDVGEQVREVPQVEEEEEQVLLEPLESRLNSNDTATLRRWVDAALRVVRAHLEDEAQRPVASEMNLYVAAATSNANARLVAVLPDGAISRSGARDAWIVLDPSPAAPFGHTVYVFAVDFNTQDSSCLANGGHTLGKSTAVPAHHNNSPN